MFKILLLLSFAVASCMAACSCYTSAVTPASGSLCPSGSFGYCGCVSSITDPSAASAAAGVIQTAASAITSTGQQVVAAVACGVTGGTPGPAWTNPAQVCPTIPTCSASACPAATTAAGVTVPAASGSASVPCCSSVIGYISQWCNYNQSLAFISAGYALSGFSKIPRFPSGLSTCTNTGCQPFPGEATQSCQSATVTPPTGSICTGGSVSICTGFPGVAAAVALSVQAAQALVQTTSQNLLGTVACGILGGTPGSAWTNSKYFCPPLPTCSSSTCPAPTTVTAAPASTATPTSALPYCCSSIRTYVGNFCANSPLLTSLISSNVTFSSTLLSIPGISFSTCSDTNCQTFTGISAAMPTSVYSMTVLLLAFIMSLVALL